MGPRTIAQEALLERIENQIRCSTPPETRETFERLVASGYSPGMARRLIGRVAAELIYEGLHRRRGFDLGAYVRALSDLPGRMEKQAAV